MKIIKSQDNQQLHFMPMSIPCHFSIAAVLVDGENEGEKVSLYSVGINGVSFGVFKQRKEAEKVLNKLSDFLFNDTDRFQIPQE